MNYETEYDAYDTAEEASVCLPLRLAATLVENRYLRDFSSAEPEEKKQFLKELEDFLAQFLAQSTISGSADEWHNLSVELARQNLYSLSCDVLDRGLAFYPKNVDLLADYLQYGINCGRTEQCKAACKTLVKIPKKLWSWRSFHFLVEYYKEQMTLATTDKELEKYQTEITVLLKQYHLQFPDDERSYDCEAEVCRALNDRRREEAVLQQALATLKTAPKCAMQLAVLYFDRGEYEKALVMAQRALNSSVQVQMGVDEAHLSYLSGLAKFALLLLKEETDGYPEDIVLDIYTDFETALRQSLNFSLRGTLKQRTIRLSIKSGIPVPPKCEELNDLIA